MSDLTRTVGEIRMFVQSVDRTAQPRMAVLAGEFARACAEVNDRLSRCAGFLRQGLRSEAIQSAQTPPDLLDQVALLDFPERAEWDALALGHGWPRAAPLAIDLAAAVNEAYAEADPLEELLRQHRRLALVRAPLPARLAVMRRIKDLDPNNLMWAEDVRRFEAVRIGQVEREATAARARRDGSALVQLAAEVDEPGWLTPLPEPTATVVGDAARYVKREEARAALRSLIAPLDQARAANDAVSGRQLRGRWMSLLDDAALTPRDPLWGQAESALDWLEGEDARDRHEQAFREALQDLEQAIADRAPRAAVTLREQAVRGFGLHVPSDLEARLQACYRELGRLSRRRNRLVLAAVGATTFILVSLVGWANANQKRDRVVRQRVAQIQSALEAGRIEDARAALEALESSYPGASEQVGVQPVAARLMAAEQKETERADQFGAALIEARSAPLLQEDVPALKTARSLARLSTEKAQVEQLESTRRAGLEQERSRVGREVMANLEAARSRLAAVESSVRDAPEDGTALGSLRADLHAIAEQAKGAADDVRAAVADAVKKADALESSRAATAGREALLTSMARAAAAIRRPEDVKPYVDACRRYKDAFPSEARSADLVQVTEQPAAWERVAAWTALVRSWPAGATNLTPKVAADRMHQLASLGDDLSGFPDHERIERYRRYVESRARLAGGEDESPAAQLRRLFSNPLVKSAYRVVSTDGRVFYSLKEPKDTPTGTFFQKLLTIDCQAKQQFLQKSVIASQGRAPQSALATRVLALLDEPADTPAQWDATMVEILFRIRKDTEVDAVLRTILLKGCVQAAIRGDACLEAGLKPLVDRIEQAHVNLNVAWVDPDDDEAFGARERALTLLAGLPAFGSSAQLAEKARRALEADARQYHVPVGVLLKDADGSWQCRTAGARKIDAQELWVVGSKGAWRRIGKGGVDEGAEGAALVEGQLLFIEQAAG